jgi:hypothetical protein
MPSVCLHSNPRSTYLNTPCSVSLPTGFRLEDCRATRLDWYKPRWCRRRGSNLNPLATPKRGHKFRARRRQFRAARLAQYTRLLGSAAA